MVMMMIIKPEGHSESVELHQGQYNALYVSFHNIIKPQTRFHDLCFPSFYHLMLNLTLVTMVTVVILH